MTTNSSKEESRHGKDGRCPALSRSSWPTGSQAVSPRPESCEKNLRVTMTRGFRERKGRELSRFAASRAPCPTASRAWAASQSGNSRLVAGVDVIIDAISESLLDLIRIFGLVRVQGIDSVDVAENHFVGDAVLQLRCVSLVAEPIAHRVPLDVRLIPFYFQREKAADRNSTQSSRQIGAMKLECRSFG